MNSTLGFNSQLDLLLKPLLACFGANEKTRLKSNTKQSSAYFRQSFENRSNQYTVVVNVVPFQLALSDFLTPKLFNLIFHSNDIFKFCMLQVLYVTIVTRELCRRVFNQTIIVVGRTG